MAALGDELVRHCWQLLHDGQPYRALVLAERALRLYQPPADSVLAGRLSLIVGVSLAALGRDGPARRTRRLHLAFGVLLALGVLAARAIATRVA